MSSAALAISLVSATIALGSLASARFYWSSNVLQGLVATFDERAFFTRMWRFDQATRVGRESWSTDHVEIASLSESIAKEALAMDWTSDRADMYQTYFFALRTHAWLDEWPSWEYMKKRRARRLNKTFGHQLLSTLLNQRIVACRLINQSHPGEKREQYYPVHYGLRDPAYTELVSLLAADLLAEGQLAEEVRAPLEEKKKACDARLAELPPPDTPGSALWDAAGLTGPAGSSEG